MTFRKTKNGTWEVRVWDNSRAKHVQRTFKTKKEAHAWGLDQEVVKKRGGLVDPADSRTPLARWWERFQETTEWQDLRPTSRQAYASVMKMHILPRWGQVKLMDIRRAAIKEWIAQVAREHTPQTAGEALKVLRRVLQVAVEGTLIVANPAAGLKRPKAEVRPHRVLSVDEVESIAEAAGTHGLMVRFMAWTGLRFGEVCALKVRHLNLLIGTVRVQDQVVTWGGKRHLGQPKTEAAKREVSMAGFLVDAMAKHIEGLGPDDLVFPSKRGGYMQPSNITDRVWRPALKAAGIKDPQPRIHDLRHTAVSLAIQAGAHPKEVQAMAGHTSFNTTMDIYAGLMPGMGASLAGRMDDLRTSSLGGNLGNTQNQVIPLDSKRASDLG